IAETQFANQRNQIRFAVEQAFFQLESNLSNIGTATRAVELAEESLRLARLRFQAGVGTQTDVIEAQTSLTTERGNLLSSITDYNQSFADLNRQVSNTPDNGLQDLP
ncbi:MAG: TolC family protein, partial [Cyanobacteria bacterium J06648_1]